MWFFIFIALFLIAISVVVITNPVRTARKNIEFEGLSELKENLYKHVHFLTGLDPPRNTFNIKSLDKAAEYIYEHFSKYCDSTYYQEFSVDNRKYKNVICEFGKGNKVIVVGAHYDVCCEQPGADDNASGVAGLLEIARLLHKNKFHLKNKVQLVAYTLEEPPFFATENMGSFVHAKGLYESKTKVDFMISLEMIGYFSEEENSQKFPFPILKLFYPTKGNFIGIVGRPADWLLTRKIKQKMKEVSNVEVKSINIPNIIPGVDFSDHRNYWKFGYRAVMITDTAFYRNPNYHTEKDTIDTLDFDKMAEVVKGVFNVILGLGGRNDT